MTAQPAQPVRLARPAPRRASGRRTPAARRRALALGVLLAALAALLVPPGTTPARADGIREQQRWALDAINAPAAWETTRGAGVTVAVLDTGVDATHPDLSENVLEGRDFVDLGSGPGDPHWGVHGTAMASIIAAHGHGPGGDSGVLGVAPEARILPVRVLLEDDDPQRDEARDFRSGALAEGIRWAADQGADVINLSLGDDSESAHPAPDEDAAVRYALRKGAVVVASAGNGGEQGDPVSYPAGYPGVIAVTAVDRTGSRADFSTRRWYAAVSAPGKDVIVADPDGFYYNGWGTSAAAAFVSGSAALLRAAHPDLTPADVKRLLTQTAQRPPEGGRSDALGSGLVDPAAALEAAARQAADEEPGDGVADEEARDERDEEASDEDEPDRAAADGGEPGADYGEKYFGPGPRAAEDAGGDRLLPVVGAGALGAAFLGLAGWLLAWFRRPSRHR